MPVKGEHTMARGAQESAAGGRALRARRGEDRGHARLHRIRCAGEPALLVGALEQHLAFHGACRVGARHLCAPLSRGLAEVHTKRLPPTTGAQSSSRSDPCRQLSEQLQARSRRRLGGRPHVQLATATYHGNRCRWQLAGTRQVRRPAPLAMMAARSAVAREARLLGEPLDQRAFQGLLPSRFFTESAALSPIHPVQSRTPAA